MIQKVSERQVTLYASLRWTQTKEGSCLVCLEGMVYFVAFELPSICLSVTERERKLTEISNESLASSDRLGESCQAIQSTNTRYRLPYWHCGPDAGSPLATVMPQITT